MLYFKPGEWNEETFLSMVTREYYDLPITSSASHALSNRELKIYDDDVVENARKQWYHCLKEHK